jgi:hypothetical protein
VVHITIISNLHLGLNYYFLYFVNKTMETRYSVTLLTSKRNNIYILKCKMVEYIMKKEICGTFHAECGI